MWRELHEEWWGRCAEDVGKGRVEGVLGGVNTARDVRLSGFQASGWERAEEDSFDVDIV